MRDFSSSKECRIVVSRASDAYSRSRSCFLGIKTKEKSSLCTVQERVEDKVAVERDREHSLFVQSSFVGRGLPSFRPLNLVLAHQRIWRVLTEGMVTRR